ncbi:RNA-guided endonuclease InsQ/TnpB family protein [Ktedonobacter racemifer]|uniref:Transposase, IS605 OrfB family n=1 Tax=Ktedonobacter racemifer DSM 44963 TaxID=485913 RepID=D6TYW1_KTERA|nr:RNA-guided endonuclease TnpB family protein [Ktedonobacter racemifer]EFH85186.1 transposase, IS605 OrfB family [Ktedonobacter racemifer DSM 44963]
MYQIKRVKIGKTPQVEELAHACGEVYTATLVSFWRTVRKKGIWLKPKHLMRWHTSNKLHAHTADACVQAFFASLKSWRERRKTDPTAKPPRRRKWYFRIEYKRSAMRVKNGKLVLSNGKGNEPLVLDWAWTIPQTLVICWTGIEYEAIATYEPCYLPVPENGDKVAGIDLGEIHMAVSHDGEHTYILNGRLLRSKRQYRNKVLAKLQKKIDAKKKGSRRRKKLVRSKQKQLKKLANQIKTIEHQSTSRFISTLQRNGVQTLAIGDVRDIRQDLDVGSKNNQKLHQWSFGSIRHKLTYKAERVGMLVEIQEESYTSKTCPVCGKRRKSPVQGRNFCCTNKACGWKGHRDLVGACNIRYKYRGEMGIPHVVGADMAAPIGLRFMPHIGVARKEKMYLREAAGLRDHAEKSLHH